MSSPETVRSRSARCSAAIAFMSANQAGPLCTAFLISSHHDDAGTGEREPSERVGLRHPGKDFPLPSAPTTGRDLPAVVRRGNKQRHIDVGTSLERADRRDPFGNFATQTPIG